MAALVDERRSSFSPPVEAALVLARFAPCFPYE